MIRFLCPSCRFAASAPADCAGRVTKCRQCGQALKIPKAQAQPPPPSPSPLPRDKAKPPASPVQGSRGADKGSMIQKPQPPGKPGAKTAGQAPAPQTRPLTQAPRKAALPPRPAAAQRFARRMVLLLVVFAAGGLVAVGLMRYLESDKKDGGEVGIQAKAPPPTPQPPAEGPAPGPVVEVPTQPKLDPLSPTPRQEDPAPKKEVPPLLPTTKEEPPKREPAPPVELPKPPRKDEPQPQDPPAVKPTKPSTLDPTLDPRPGGTPPEAVVVKRRSETSDEDLRKQLLTVPEVGLDQAAAAALYAPLQAFTRRGGSPPSLEPDYGPRFLTDLARSQKRPEMTYFPWRMGADCQLGKESAERLHVLSVNLRTCLQASTPQGDIRPDPDNLRALLLKGHLPGNAVSRVRVRGVGSAEIKPSEWHEPGAIPALMQMLQTENTATRLLLVEMLSNIKGKEAGGALASRALFDLSLQVREKAVLALVERPAAEYRQLLLDGFRYPWPAAADHAAETLVAVKDLDALPALVDLLNEPDTTLPFTVKVKDKEILATRELVRINHLSNCMLCHAPSLTKEDLVRGRVPVPGEEPPRLYYAETSGLFVRATTTYLRQDFSVVQPVARSGKWPESQRFDYLMRTRPVSNAERQRFEQLQKKNPQPDSYEQREAVLFTLRELTGKNLGSTSEAWKPILKTLAPSERTKEQPPRKDN